MDEERRARPYSSPSFPLLDAFSLGYAAQLVPRPARRRAEDSITHKNLTTIDAAIAIRYGHQDSLQDSSRSIKASADSHRASLHGRLLCAYAATFGGRGLWNLGCPVSVYSDYFYFYFFFLTVGNWIVWFFFLPVRFKGGMCNFQSIATLL